MSEELHYSIIQSLAEAEGVEPERLDFDLYKYMDLDALMKLYRQGSNNPTVSFEVDRYEVTVTSDETVTVTARSQKPS